MTKMNHVLYKWVKSPTRKEEKTPLHVNEYFNVVGAVVAKCTIIPRHIGPLIFGMRNEEEEEEEGKGDDQRTKRK